MISELIKDKGELPEKQRYNSVEIQRVSLIHTDPGFQNVSCPHLSLLNEVVLLQYEASWDACINTVIEIQCSFWNF